MPVGTQENPIRTKEPIKVARACLEDRFSPDGLCGLHFFKGSFFEWYGNRWCIRDADWLRTTVWLWLEEAHYSVDNEGLNVHRFSPTTSKVDGIMDALHAVCTLRKTEVPMWVVKPSRNPPPVSHMVAFEDVLVNVRTGNTMVRDSKWFDPMVIPCNYDPKAKCARWELCCDEWSDGDPEWITLLQRWIGYCLLNHRKYAKWMLLHGKIRSGKGTIARIIRLMVGPDCFLNSSLDDLAESHGLAGLEHARVLSISDVGELYNKDAERATRVLKNILGRDPITINPKHLALIRNVIVNAAPMMQSNEIPKLPNKARGLSSKMLVLPFDVSFEGKEQFDLDEVLEQELPGIAAWAVTGAMELEKETDPRLKFEMPPRSIEEVRLYHLTNNPFDFFLEARFQRNAKGKVAYRLVKREWHDWVKKNRVKMHVPENQLPYRLVQESSWDIRRGTRTSADRFLEGLSLLKESDDET